MPFQKGRQKTGGRQVGTPNHRTEVRREVLATATAQLPVALREGITPLEGMLICMHVALAAQDWSLFLAAASAAAPYMHPRLQSTDLRITTSQFEHLSNEELETQIAELEAKRRETVEAEAEVAAVEADIEASKFKH